MTRRDEDEAAPEANPRVRGEREADWLSEDEDKLVEATVISDLAVEWEAPGDQIKPEDADNEPQVQPEPARAWSGRGDNPHTSVDIGLQTDVIAAQEEELQTGAHPQRVLSAGRLQHNREARPGEQAEREAEERHERHRRENIVVEGDRCAWPAVVLDKLVNIECKRGQIRSDELQIIGITTVGNAL